MMRRRSVSFIVVQVAISSSVRPQPRQSPVRGSMVQTLVQGELIGIVRDVLRFGRHHRGGGAERNAAADPTASA